MRLVLTLLCTAFAASAADAPPSGQTSQTAQTGQIAGRISMAGLSPKLPPLPVTKDNKICGVNRADEALVVANSGGIKNAVLWVADAPPPAESGRRKLRLDQQGCRFEPHVVVAHAGTTLEVMNSDVVLHHPTAKLSTDKLWDFPMPLKNYAVDRPLPKAGIINVTCEAHPWMKAIVVVLDAGPSGVSDEEGHYSLVGVPAGKHKLKLWHERLGEREEEVEVKAGETATRDITLQPR